MLRRYGYSMDVDELPPIMTADEFSAATGGVLSASTETIEWALSAYSDAIRSYCGWHVAPALGCVCESDGGRVIDLPALSVSDVAYVRVGDETIDPSCYEWSGVGVVRFTAPCAAVSAGWRGVEVGYTAGVDGAGALQAALASMVQEFLVSHPGITNQSAGGTQVGYSATRGIMAHAAELAPWRAVV